MTTTPPPLPPSRRSRDGGKWSFASSNLAKWGGRPRKRRKSLSRSRSATRFSQHSITKFSARAPDWRGELGLMRTFLQVVIRTLLVSGSKKSHTLRRDYQEARANAGPVHSRRQWGRQKRWRLHIKDSSGIGGLQQRVFEGESSYLKFYSIEKIYFKNKLFTTFHPKSNISSFKKDFDFDINSVITLLPTAEFLT